MPPGGNRQWFFPFRQRRSMAFPLRPPAVLPCVLTLAQAMESG
jgi:hypothetical protein